jgi:predicted ATPase
MITRVSGGKDLPKEIVDQIIDRTDGVPLFIEELTKTVIESGVLAQTSSGYTMGGLLPPLAIPTTLQASLLARLDRLAPVREVAQIAAAIGRQFSHELISAVARMPQQLLDSALAQLVDAELIFRRGTPPNAEYTFKHALVQDAAYQSLLRGKRQQYHLQIAEALRERFPEVAETQPELLAHHYSEADLRDKAIPFWQAAGQKAMQRSANVEAVHHLTKGLELLRTMPECPERTQQELALLVALGTPLTVTKGFASAEVGRVYGRARELCRQVGGRQLFPALWGLWVFYTARAEHNAARDLGEQCRRLAEDAGDPELLIAAHHAQGVTLTSIGELCSGLEHLEQAIAIYDPNRHRPRALISGVACRSQAALALWFRGQPDQALKKNEEALILAQGLSRPYSLAQAAAFAAVLHQLLRDRKTARTRAETAIELSTEHEFPFWRAMGMIVRGWTLTDTTEMMTGIAEVRQGLTVFSDAGGEIMRPYFLALLVDLYGKVGQPEAPTFWRHRCSTPIISLL